jgi:hypothetical protein
MPHVRQDLAPGHAVAAQPVGNNASRLEPEAGQQPLEDALGRAGVPPVLDQDVEHDPLLVRRAPEVVQHAVDRQEHCIEVPGAARLRPAPAQTVNGGGILERLAE